MAPPPDKEHGPLLIIVLTAQTTALPAAVLHRGDGMAPTLHESSAEDTHVDDRHPRLI